MSLYLDLTDSSFGWLCLCLCLWAAFAFDFVGHVCVYAIFSLFVDFSVLNLAFRFSAFAVVLILLSATRRESLFINIAILKFTVHLETVVPFLLYVSQHKFINICEGAGGGHLMPHFIYMLEAFFICFFLYFLLFLFLRNFQNHRMNQVFLNHNGEVFCSKQRSS